MERKCPPPQIELEGRCFENNRTLDYIRCYHQHSCGVDSEAVCDEIGCQGVICEFDSTEVIQMFHQCSQCGTDESGLEKSYEIVGFNQTDERMDGRIDFVELPSGGMAGHVDANIDFVELPSDGMNGHIDANMSGNPTGGSLLEAWKTLADQKRKLVADFVLPGLNYLIHEDGTDSAFEAVASDFTRSEFKKNALVDLPLLTSYEDICCLGAKVPFPDPITPEYVISEFVKQVNFHRITCENPECGPKPSQNL